MAGKALTSAAARRGLVRHLDELGLLGDARWRRAVGRVPREMFLRDGFFLRRDQSEGAWWEPVHPGRPGWIELAYADQCHVTQLDGALSAVGVRAACQGSPTSSAMMPSLVLRLLTAAEIGPGARVLEIGTGSGYSAALLAEVLGEGHVTSIEADPAISDRADQALRATGYQPRLLVGDGLSDLTVDRCYDRIIATCSVRAIPAVWLRHLLYEGLILVPIGGWLGAGGLLRLRGVGPGAAEGCLLPGAVSCTAARAHTPPEHEWIRAWDATGADTGRGIAVGADEVFGDPTALLLAQLALPGVVHTRIGGRAPGEPYLDYLTDTATDSHAVLFGNGTGLVRQSGPVRIWDQVEHTVLAWREAGSPGQDTLTVRITPQDAGTVTAAGITYRLPDPAPTTHPT